MTENNNAAEEHGGIVRYIEDHPYIPYAYLVTTAHGVRNFEYFLVRWGQKNPLPIQSGDTLYADYTSILWTRKEDINGGSEKIVRLAGCQEPKRHA